MQKNSVVDLINKELKKYGSNTYGEPLFRVVFSDDQTETRKGTFTDFHSKIIKIRTVTEIREVQKYPWIKGKWILERWASGDISYHRDLVSVKNGVYICVYTFQDANQNYLPPLLKVAEIVVKHLLSPRNKYDALNQDAETAEKEANTDTEKIFNGLQIESDESKTKDPNSERESLSVGFGEENRRKR